jgi:hypothetical protein
MKRHRHRVGWRDVRFEKLRHGALGLISVLAAGCIAVAGCAVSRPDGVDLNPITSLRFNAGSDFLGPAMRECVSIPIMGYRWG